MKQIKVSEEQITYALQQVEGGTPVHSAVDLSQGVLICSAVNLAFFIVFAPQSRGPRPLT